MDNVSIIDNYLIKPCLKPSQSAMFDSQRINISWYFHQQTDSSPLDPHEHPICFLYFHIIFPSFFTMFYNCPGFPHHFPIIFPCLSDSPAPLAWRVWRRPEMLREFDNFSDFSSRSVLRQPKATSSWKMSRMAWWPMGRRGRWEILNWEINLYANHGAGI